MNLAGDQPSDYMRGYRNGRASVLAEIGLDPRVALEATSGQDPDIALRLAAYGRMIVAAETSQMWQNQAKQLHTAMLLADADVHRIVTAALGALASRPIRPGRTGRLEG